MSTTAVELGTVLDFFNGKAPPNDEDGDFVVYGSNGTIGKAKSTNHENAIILGRVGAYCGSVEFCDEKFWASDNTIVVKTRDGFDLKYMYYRLKSFPLRSYAGGAAQPLLTQTILRGVRLPVVKDKNRQVKIASILSAYDDLIENNRRRIALLEQAVQLLYREWFVCLRFPGHEHTKVIDGVPVGWERKTLGDVAPLKYGKALKEDDRIPGAFPVYGSSGIVGTHAKAFVPGPTIIVGRKGNVGSVYWSSTDCHPIDTVYYIDSELCSFFLYYALQQMSFISTDVAVPGLNRDFAHSRSILIADQKTFRLFEETVWPIHQQMDLLKRQNTSLARARDLLLPKLMNGEVAV